MFRCFFRSATQCVAQSLLQHTVGVVVPVVLDEDIAEITRFGDRTADLVSLRNKTTIA